MPIRDLDGETLRRLSGVRPSRGKVLSLYLNLDPSEFATPAARETAITSLLDEAERRARDDTLDHEARAALRADVERARAFFRNGFSAKESGAVAVFACGAADLFETLRLPRPVDSEVVVDDSAWVEPLARLGAGERVCVVLVSRRSGRMLRGTRERLEEVANVHDDVHGQHDQGGWSQPRYQRGIEKEVADHLGRVADRLFAAFKRRPFDRLVIGATEELAPAFEERLHPYVRERLVGRLEIEVEHATPGEVAERTAPVLQGDDRRRESAALQRLEAGLGRDGHAEAGLDAVLGALNERRVEALLYAAGTTAPGVSCPRCGWLGTAAQACPLDGAALDRRDNVVEDAIEAAVLQSAEPVVVRDGGLERHGGIAALLRF